MPSIFNCCGTWAPRASRHRNIQPHRLTDRRIILRQFRLHLLGLTSANQTEHDKSRKGTRSFSMRAFITNLSKYPPFPVFASIARVPPPSEENLASLSPELRSSRLLFSTGSASEPPPADESPAARSWLGFRSPCFFSPGVGCGVGCGRWPCCCLDSWPFPAALDHFFIARFVLRFDPSAGLLLTC